MNPPTRGECGRVELWTMYVPAYDGLRFFLLIGVLEYHYLHGQPIAGYWFLTYSLCCFFVLSGFLITHLLLRCEGRASPGRLLVDFYLRRALRVFPAYYFVLTVAALTLGVPYLAWQATYLWNIKLYFLSAQPLPLELGRYMQSWETNGVHLWSMGVEEQFYLLYPPLLIGLGPRLRTPLLLLGIAACIAIRLSLARAYPQAYYGALLPVAGEYILWGCLLAWLDLQGRWPALRGRWPLWTGLAGLVTLFGLDGDILRYQAAQWQPPPHQTVYAILLALFVLGLKHNREHPISRLIGAKPWARLGKISYSAYLVHLFLNPVADALLARLPFLAVFPQAPRALVGPVLALSTAGLMWVTFEERANRAKDRWAPA